MFKSIKRELVGFFSCATSTLTPDNLSGVFLGWVICFGMLANGEKLADVLLMAGITALAFNLTIGILVYAAGIGARIVRRVFA